MSFYFQESNPRMFDDADLRYMEECSVVLPSPPAPASEEVSSITCGLGTVPTATQQQQQQQQASAAVVMPEPMSPLSPLEKSAYLYGRPIVPPKPTNLNGNGNGGGRTEDDVGDEVLKGSGTGGSGNEGEGTTSSATPVASAAQPPPPPVSVCRDGQHCGSGSDAGEESEESIEGCRECSRSNYLWKSIESVFDFLQFYRRTSSGEEEDDEGSSSSSSASSSTAGGDVSCSGVVSGSGNGVGNSAGNHRKAPSSSSCGGGGGDGGRTSSPTHSDTDCGECCAGHAPYYPPGERAESAVSTVSRSTQVGKTLCYPNNVPEKNITILNFFCRFLPTL